MPKDDLVYVGHMLDTARQAVEKVAEIARAEFDADENLRLALTHLIQPLSCKKKHTTEARRHGEHNEFSIKDTDNRETTWSERRGAPCPRHNLPLFSVSRCLRGDDFLQRWGQVIGEAARQVSGEFREAHPQVPWNRIVGMRHRVVHNYLHVDYDLVWGVVTRDLTPLIELLSGMVSPDGPDPGPDAGGSRR